MQLNQAKRDKEQELVELNRALDKLQTELNSIRHATELEASALERKTAESLTKVRRWGGEMEGGEGWWWWGGAAVGRDGRVPCSLKGSSVI